MNGPETEIPMREITTLSVIVPIYQEASIIGDTLRRLHAVLSESDQRFEIIVADDGSTDGGESVVFRAAAELNHVGLIRHPANRGRGFIIMKAMKHAAGEIVAYIDADLQIDPEVLPRLTDAVRRGADIAVGSKYHRESRLSYSLYRKLQSGVYCTLVRLLLHPGTFDCQCGAKAFRRQSMLDLIPHMTCDSWSWDTEMILKGSLAGLNIVEVPVTVRRTPGRKSKVRATSSLSMSWQLVRLWMWSRQNGATFGLSGTSTGAPSSDPAGDSDRSAPI